MAAAHLEIEGALPLKAIMHAPMLLRRQPDIRELDAIDQARAFLWRDLDTSERLAGSWAFQVEWIVVR